MKSLLFCSLVLLSGIALSSTTTNEGCPNCGSTDCLLFAIQQVIQTTNELAATVAQLPDGEGKQELQSGLDQLLLQLQIQLQIQQQIQQLQQIQQIQKQQLLQLQSSRKF